MTSLLVRIFFPSDNAVVVGKVGKLIIRVSIRWLVDAISLHAVCAEALKTAATRLLSKCLLEADCVPNMLTVSGAAWVTKLAVSTTIMYGLLLTPKVLASADRLLAPPVVVVVVVILVLVEETAAVVPIVLSVDPDMFEVLVFRVMIGANALLGLVLSSMAWCGEFYPVIVLLTLLAIIRLSVLVEVRTWASLLTCPPRLLCLVLSLTWPTPASWCRCRLRTHRVRILLKLKMITKWSPVVLVLLEAWTIRTILLTLNTVSSRFLIRRRCLSVPPP